jgi:probable F420-dependent oxidoreductase
VARFQAGIQLHPQATTMQALRRAAREADALGVDSIWTWDHFYPLYGDPDAAHFEGWTTLTAIACDTSHARIGHLVTCNSYRNPDLLADMARTVDHVSGGRLTLGLGAGWFERDYAEYGYEFGTAGDRLRHLERGLERVRARLPRLVPGPVGDLPILVGGGGETVTLRLVATHADAWNGFGPPASWARKNAILDDWCAEVGRDPAEIERTVLIRPEEVDQADDFVEAGATHLVVQAGDPFDLAPVERLLAAARG